MKKKALVCGDLTKTDWHPLSNIMEEIRQILSPAFEVTFEEHFESLGAEGYAAYDLMICNIEYYLNKEQLWPHITHDLVTYVAGGGKILLPHVPSVNFAGELAQMFGFRFRMHPPIYEVPFRVSDPDHPIVRGVEDFTIREERLQLVYDRHTPIQVFLEVEGPTGCTPAGWTAAFGLGQVVHLMPGHDVHTYRHPMFRKLFFNAACWLAGMTPEEGRE